MTTDLICLNSDAVNRYGFRIHVTALSEAMKKNYHYGMPYLIGHDFHRPIGWTTPFGLFIEPGLSRFMARRSMYTDASEKQQVHQAVSNTVAMRIKECFEPHEKQFLTALKGKLKDKFAMIDCSGAAVIQDGLVEKLFPKLWSKRDDDGLLFVQDIAAEFDYFSQGIFKHKKLPFCIYTHDYFRRRQSRFNNLNYHFLDNFMMLVKDNQDVRLRISIDEDLIGYTPSIHGTGELVYHWGPPYTDDISNIKSGQVTRHACEEWEADFYGIDSMDFYCKKENSNIVLETEELQNLTSPQADDLYHCRYTHAIYNTKDQSFEHFDGAIRSYEEEEMEKRKQETFVEYGRKAKYKKLFRIDGKLPLNKWKSFVTDYYQDNPLIYEYFGKAEDRKEMMPKDDVLPVLEKLLPYRDITGEGIKLFVSYHPVREPLRGGRHVDITDVMAAGEVKQDSLEYRIHDVRIALEKLGQKLEIPASAKLFTIDDNYWNIPSIMHNEEDVQASMQHTVTAFINLFTAMVGKGLDKTTSLTLSFPLNDRIVRISSFGKLTQLLPWLKTNFPLTVSEEALTKWIEQQTKYLASFKPNVSNNLPAELIQMDGVLYIRRKPMPFPFDLPDDTKGLKYTIQFPKTEEDEEGIFELVSTGQLGIATAISIESIIWNDTGESYLTSSRSAWLDPDIPDISVYPEKILALYWADPVKA